MPDIFDSLASQKQPSQQQTTAPPAPTPAAATATNGDVFDQLAAGHDPSQQQSGQQPEPDTFWNRAKHFVEHPIDTLTSPTPGYDPYDKGEQDKARIYQTASADFHAGNYKKAAGDLLDLFDSSKNAAAKESKESIKQASIGAAKSAGQTALTGADLASMGMTRDIAPAIRQRAETALEPSNADQHAGAQMESVIEFMLGDELLKGASYSERLMKSAKAAKLLEQYPRLMSILGDAMRGGTVGGAVGGVHGGTEGAIEGALTGAAFNGLTSTVSEIPGIAADVKNARAASKAVKIADAGSGPVEAQVSRAVRGSNLTEGKLASVAPSGDDIQPQLQQGVRNVMNDVATEAGVKPQAPKSIRDVTEHTADSILGKSKAAYAQLDEASGGHWQRFDDQLRNIRSKMREVAGIDDDKFAELELKQNDIETLQANLIEELKTSGKIDPKLADSAAADWKKAQSLYDLDSAVKTATTGRAGIGKGTESLDPNKLVSRLHKLYDSGRLQTAVGEERAAAMIDHAETAQLALQNIKAFEPSLPTGKQAFETLIRDNTVGKSKLLKGGKITGETNWNGVVKDFENLAPEKQQAMFGNEVSQVRQYIQRQALKQNATAALKTLAKFGIGGALALKGGESVMGHLMQ